MREIIPIQYGDEITVRTPTIGTIQADVVLKVYERDNAIEIVSYMSKKQAKEVIRALQQAIKEA